jgi:protein-disulfide isomerase
VARAVKIKSPAQRAREQTLKQEQDSRQRRRRLMLLAAAFAAVAVAGLVAAGALTQGGGGGATSSLSSATRAGKTLGSADAPVTITAWEDFQCPFCKQVNAAALTQVISDYVDSGKVKIVYQQFPVLGSGGANDESLLAAQASEYAAEQGLFWEYHDALFAAQSGENRGTFTKDNLVKIGAQVGLDPAELMAALDNGTYKAAVQQEKAAGAKLGVTSTPTFFVNGASIVGVQPYSVFKAAIDQALQAGAQ